MQQGTGVLRSVFKIHIFLISLSLWSTVWVRAVTGLPWLRFWGASVLPSWRVLYGLWQYPESLWGPSHMLLHAVAWWGCTGSGAAVSKLQDRTQNALGNCLPNVVWGSVWMGLLISPSQKASAGRQLRSHSFPFLFFHSAAPVKFSSLHSI